MVGVGLLACSAFGRKWVTGGLGSLAIVKLDSVAHLEIFLKSLKKVLAILVGHRAASKKGK
jgi:hypothetical protein